MDNYIDILQQWEIPEVKDVEEIKKNVFRVICKDNKKYILKIRKNIEKIKTEYELLKYLKENQIPVAEPLINKKGMLYVDKESTKYCLYHCLDGSHLKYDFVKDNRDVLNKYGIVLGKLHKKMNEYSGIKDKIEDMNLERQILNWAIPEINRYSEDNRIRLIIDELGSKIEELFKKFSKQFIHRDPHGENILFKDEKWSGFIDFDLCVIGYKSFDLCYIITGILMEGFEKEENREKWLGLIPEVISGYEEENKLEVIEKESFWYMFIFIQMIFIAYFYSINNNKLAEINLEGLYWIYDNRDRILEKTK